MQNGFGVQQASNGRIEEQASIGNPIMDSNGTGGTRSSTPISPGHGIVSTMVMSPPMESDVDDINGQVKSESRGSDDESGRSKGSKKVRKPRTIYR